MMVSLKYPEQIQDVLKVIIHKHQVSKVSVAVILDEVTHALRSEISAKGNDNAQLSYDRAEMDKMVGTLIKRISIMAERSTKNNVMRSLPLSHEKSELILRLDHLVLVCSDVLDGKANLERLTDEDCLILEWIVSQCLLCLDGIEIVDYNTNNSDGNESLRTLSIREKDAMQSTKLEIVLGTQQEREQGSVETTEDLIPDVTSEIYSQSELITSICLMKNLLPVRQDQGDSLQGQHLVRCEAESAASDGSKEKLAVAEEEGKQLTTTSAISAAARKLAKCQETMANLSKQLHALENPAIADAPEKMKCGTLPPSAANLLSEADPKPQDSSTLSPEEESSKTEHGEPDATKKSLDHEQDSGQSPKAGKSGSTPVVVRPTVSKSPPTSISVDAKKKKRRANLLSRLVLRKKA